MMVMMMMVVVMVVIQVEMIKANLAESWLGRLLRQLHLLLLKLGRVLNHVVLDCWLWLLNRELLLWLWLGLMGFGRGQSGKLGCRLGLKLEQIVVVVGMGVVLKLLEGSRIEGGGSVGKQSGLLLLLLLQRRRSAEVGTQGIPVERGELGLVGSRWTHDDPRRVVDADGDGGRCCGGTVWIIWR